MMRRERHRHAEAYGRALLGLPAGDLQRLHDDHARDDRVRRRDSRNDVAGRGCTLEDRTYIYLILYMADNIYISHNEKEREIEIGIEERPLTSKRLCIGIPNI